MLYLILILITVGLLVSIYANFSLFRKNEKYETIVSNLEEELEETYDFIQQFSNNLTAIDNQLTQIDNKGVFASDDEVGYTFTTIKLITSQLQQFNINKYAKEKEE